MYSEYSKSIFAPMCHAFKMRLKLHNSADQGISHLLLRLVVCFYPQLPVWPWSWGHTYRHLARVECYCFFKNNFEVGSDASVSIVVDPSIKALKNIIIRWCTIYLDVRSWSSYLAWSPKIIGRIVRSLLDNSLVARHWKRSFVSLLIIIIN